jgi:hypothetical protein
VKITLLNTGNRRNGTLRSGMIFRAAMLTAILVTAAILRPATALAGGALDPKEASKETEVLDVETLFPSEEGLVSVQVTGVASHDFLARFMGDTIFIPFVGVSDFLRLNNTVSSDLMSLTLEIAPKGTVTISRQRSTVEYGTESFSFPVTSIRIVHGEIYIEQTLMSKILGVPMLFDINSLKLMISPDNRLPVVQAATNQSRYQSLMFDRHDGHDEDLTAMQRKLFSAPVVNWTLGTSFDLNNSGTYAAQLRFGNQFLYGTFDGSLIASYGGGLQKHLNVSVDVLDWRYQTPDFSPLRQVTVGTLLIDGGRSEGIELSNVPLTPEKASRSYQLAGRAEPSWTVELYDGGRLVDVTQADSNGRYEFEIPMSYGTVDRVVRILGPHGEVENQTRRINLNQQMLPAGTVEYTAAAGLDSLSLSAGVSGAAHISAGISDRVTVGVEGLYHAADHLWSIDSLNPSAIATLWLGQATSVGLRYNVRSGIAAGELYIATASNASYRLNVDTIDVAARHEHAIGSLSYPVGAYSLGANAEVSSSPAGALYAVEPIVSGYTAGVTFLASTRFAQYVSGSRTTSTLRLSSSPLNGMLFSAEGSYDYMARTLSSLSFETYYRLTGALGINVGYRIENLDWKAGSLTAQLNLDLAAVRTTVSSGYQGGNMVTTTSISGSAILSSHGLLTFADPSVGQSSIMMEAFNDENGNGVRDNGEELLSAPEARLSMDGSDMTSDDGVFRSIPADRRCMLEIDRWAHADQELYPGRARFPIFTLPNELQVIEIPYSEGFDVIGRCGVHTEDGSRDRSNHGVVEGLRVKLTSTDGDQVFEGEVYVDGTILLSAVTPGDYRLSFDNAQIQSRRLHLSTQVPVVHLTAQDHRLPDVQFDLGDN